MDLTGLSVDVTDFLTIAVLIITATTTFWGIRKVNQLFNDLRDNR
jgi:hypothetical protein